MLFKLKKSQHRDTALSIVIEGLAPPCSKALFSFFVLLILLYKSEMAPGPASRLFNKLDFSGPTLTWRVG
ncbi:hypothetical protein TMatcc_005730 [Talaromyces marneffei ATCC 18224]